MTEPDLRPLRVGLIGAGAIAQIAQLPALSAAPGVTIAGAVTAHEATLARNLHRWPIERGYATAEAMIDGADLDAVFVLTRKHLHAQHVRLALEAGLDVYCEKPLATTLDDAAALVDLDRRTPGIFMVGLNRRYAEVYQVARRHFEPGRPQFVVAQKNRHGSEYRATLENAIHMVDLLRWFCGEPLQVHASSQWTDPYREDGTAAYITFDSGATAVLMAARSAGEWDERLEAYGDLSTVRVVAPDSVAIVRDGHTTVREMRPRAAGWANINTTAGFGPAVEHFLRCVRTRSEPLTSADEAYRSQALMQRILEAAGLPLADSETVAVDSR